MIKEFNFIDVETNLALIFSAKFYTYGSRDTKTQFSLHF